MRALFIIVGLFLLIYPFFSKNEIIKENIGKVLLAGLVILFSSDLFFKKQTYKNNTGVTYSKEVMSVLRNSNSKIFKGYVCRNDCSGHEAGYRWAQKNGIPNISYCNGNSTSFNNGCAAYVDEDY